MIEIHTLARPAAAATIDISLVFILASIKAMWNYDIFVQKTFVTYNFRQNTPVD